MRHFKVILSYVIFLVILLHANISNAANKKTLTFDGILTDTTDMNENSVWYYTGNNPLCTDEPIIMISVVRSVVIGDRLCRVLSVSIDDVIYPESELTVYYKNKQLYFHDNETWKIFYDFSLNVGDTLDYNLPSQTGYGFDIEPENPYQMVVTKVDTVFANNGQPLRRLYTERTSEIHLREGFNVSIEGIGSVSGLFGIHANVITEGCYQFLRCFTNGDYLFQLEDQCGPSSTSQVRVSTLQLTPNPGNDAINVSLPDGVDFPISYEVVGMTGQKMISGTVNSPTFDIEAVALPSATYLVRCSGRDGQQWYGQWVKM
ncbi:MAG TPA: hypothetical protein PJ990_12515 [Saprospiraceae bacterium]|nr:hypothetical protein [Saprospiraceae bacterium]